MEYYEIKKTEHSHIQFFPSHIHNHYELYYLFEGERDYYVSNSLFKVKSGTFVLVAPNVLHRTEGTSYTRLLLSFNEEFVNFLPVNIVSTLFSKIRIALSEDDKIIFENKLEQLINLGSNFEADKKKLYAKLILSTMLLELYNYNSTFDELAKINQYPNIVEQAISYMNKNFDQDIKIKDIATHSFSSIWHLCRIFKLSTKMSINDYLVGLRLNKAIEYLSQTDLPITKIASMTGFSSSTYLSTLFKKNLNISPKEYRKKFKKQ